MIRNLWLLIVTFVKIGVVGYGGGPGFIPLVEADAVRVHHWLSSTEFADVLSMGYALPGPIGTKVAFIVGYKVEGLIGGILATLAVILPSILMIAAVYIFLTTFKDNPRIAGLLRGIRPIVIALLIQVVIGLLPKSIISWQTGLITLASLGVLFFTNLHPAILIIIGGLVGIFLL